MTELLQHIPQAGGSFVGVVATMTGLFLAQKMYLKFFKNGKPETPETATKGIDKKDIDIAILKQEGECRDRYYKAIKSSEVNIIAEIRKANGG